MEDLYIIRDTKSGDLIGVDHDSGGYPFRTDTLRAAKLWTESEKAEHYISMFPKEQWELCKLNFAFRTEKKPIRLDLNPHWDKEGCWCTYNNCKHWEKDECRITHTHRMQSAGPQSCGAMALKLRMENENLERRIVTLYKKLGDPQ